MSAQGLRDAPVRYRRHHQARLQQKCRGLHSLQTRPATRLSIPTPPIPRPHISQNPHRKCRIIRRPGLSPQIAQQPEQRFSGQPQLSGHLFHRVSRRQAPHQNRLLRCKPWCQSRLRRYRSLSGPCGASLPVRIRHALDRRSRFRRFHLFPYWHDPSVASLSN